MGLDRVEQGRAGQDRVGAEQTDSNARGGGGGGAGGGGDGWRACRGPANDTI